MISNNHHYQILNIGSTQAKYIEVENNNRQEYIFASDNKQELIRILEQRKSPYSLVITTKPELIENIEQVKDWDSIDLEYIIHYLYFRGLYEGFGQDRIVNIFGASHLDKQKAFIIDFGTYTTCTAVEYDGHYHNVTHNSIAPGISLQLQSINKGNENLPEYTEQELIKNNTDSAIMLNRTKQALHQGIILQNISQVHYLQQEYSDYEFIITGGWSDVVSLHCHSILHKPDLWLYGAMEYLNIIKK